MTLVTIVKKRRNFEWGAMGYSENAVIGSEDSPKKNVINEASIDDT